MIIEKLKLNNYRNYDKLNIDLDGKLNIFIGDNAQGKSNVLESIYVLALTKSYLNVKDKDLIKDGCDYCFLEALVNSENNSYKLNVSINASNKLVKINNREIQKLVDYVSLFRVILFSPDNIRMIKDSPNVRRKYLNVEIGQMSNSYIRNLQNYNLMLRQRNEFLKLIKLSNKVNNDYLEIINRKFSELATLIIRERYLFINKVNDYIVSIYEEIMGVDNLNIKYVSSVNNDDIEKMQDEFYDKLVCNFDKEKLYGMTLIGPHRDDFKFFMGDKEMSLYASQGQLRAAVLALKLAEIEIFKEITGDFPILLLDDIFSELDISKKNRLIKYIMDDVQTIITTTDLNMVDEILIENAKIFEISCGEVVKEVERKVIQNG